MADNFESFQPSLISPAEAAEPITPNNGTDLPHVTRAIYVGGGGDLSVVMRSGQTVTLPGVQGGMSYPLRVIRVRATGTTATGLVGLR